MNEIHSPDLDLNLLRLLHELLETPNTVQVARRLGCTQSAVSHGLGRLRVALGDPLLVRVGRSLVPTSRAEALRGPLAAWRRGTEQLLAQGAPVEPARLRRTFRMSMADGAEAMLLPALLARLTSEAPHVSVAVTHQADRIERTVQQAEIDLAMGFSMREIDGVLASTLFEDTLVTLAPRAWKGGCAMDDFLARPHVVVAPRALPGGIIDEALDKHGLRRHVAVRTPSFLAALDLVDAGLWLTMPRRFAAPHAAARGLRMLRPPVATPTLSFRMLFPTTLRDDPAHRWLRERIATLLRHRR